MIGKLAQLVGILEEKPGNEFLDGVGGIVEEFLWFHDVVVRQVGFAP